MKKKKATAAELTAMLEKEIAANPDCEGIRIIQIFACECDGGWTPGFQGLIPESDGADAFGEIVNRLFDTYELATVRH